jgi:predicted NBD/HSP70 family sugar kinase
VKQIQDLIVDRSATDMAGPRGSNQSGMRAHNERLVLSLVRQHGALAKSDIARMTGLSAQTVSVIMRALENDGLLQRGEPIRGKIGQPSVPMSLAADGAFFFGLKIGRRSTDLMIIDFRGRVVATRRQTYPFPTPDAVVHFVQEALPALRRDLSPALQTRIGGLGIAMPFQLWNWTQIVGAPAGSMDDWRHRDIQAEIQACCDLPVYVQNDATAACGAELVFGSGERPTDFLYFYIGNFVGGGLSLNGQLYAGRTGNAAAIGSMPVPGPDGRMRQLISVASMASLERMIKEAGGDSAQLWATPTRWALPDGVLDRWISEASKGMAHAILCACSVIDFDTVMIDGWLTPEVRAALTQATQAELARLDLAGIEPPQVREGTVGHEARTLGAAALPLSQRYLLDQNAFLKDL